MSDHEDRIAKLEEDTSDLYALIGHEAVRADSRHREVMTTLRRIERLLGAGTNGDAS